MKSISARLSLASVFVVVALFINTAALRAETLQRSYFLGVKDFSDWEPHPAKNHIDATLLSPEYSVPVNWNELVVSWDIKPGIDVITEVRLIYPDHKTDFYTMGQWSDDPALRTSVPGQKNDDAKVSVDTLILQHTGAKVQVRLTILHPKMGLMSDIRFIGLSFCDRSFTLTEQPLDTNSLAWGKVLDVPERRQGEYELGGAWCSPTSLGMVLAYWGNQLNRPELNHTTPEIAAAIKDPHLGTGNWPFNTAYAGEYQGIRAYVARLDDVNELEQWISAGIPVIVSVSSYLTHNRTSGKDDGHLITCVGFEKNGDPIFNDPGASVTHHERARRTYPRERFIKAWKKSGNTVYLIYPADHAIPESPLHHWADSEAAK